MEPKKDQLTELLSQRRSKGIFPMKKLIQRIFIIKTFTFRI